MKIKLGPHDYSHQNPSTIVATGMWTKPYYVPCSLIGVIQHQQPVVVVVIPDNKYAIEIIHRNNDFTINYATPALFAAAEGDGHDRFGTSCLTPIKSDLILSPIIRECHYHLECMFVKMVTVRDHITLYGQIVGIQIDKSKLKSFPLHRLEFVANDSYDRKNSTS